MAWEQIGAVIALIGLVVAVMRIFTSIEVRLGKIETRLDDFIPMVREMQKALFKKRGLIHSGLTEKGHSRLPENIKDEVRRLSDEPAVRTQKDPVEMIQRRLWRSALAASKEHGQDFDELMALTAAYAEEYLANNAPVRKRSKFLGWLRR